MIVYMRIQIKKLLTKLQGMGFPSCRLKTVFIKTAHPWWIGIQKSNCL